MLDTDFGEFSFHALGRIRASRRAEALIPSPSSLRAVELLALSSIFKTPYGPFDRLWTFHPKAI
jgi:hypothetical protein